MTWPLVLGLGRDVPGDLGDSLLNLWILGWGAEHLPRVFTGQMSWTEFWNANIFHPEPLALAFSEHLFGEVLQILPIYYLTGNLILAYNLLFLSSFVLSGVGMYLLVRDLLGETGRFSWAAFIAGLIYAFVPYRIAQVAHIQSLSSQWMPFALYGFRRFIVSGTPGLGPANLLPLAGGTAALLMQNWSSGYYLVYFAPFVLIFVVHQIIASRRARNWQVWAAFAAAALVVTAATLPFLVMYLNAQRVHGFERPIGEVIRFSADIYSYVTAPEAVRLWGPVLQVYPKAEGELWFGLIPLVLMLVAIGGLKVGRASAFGKLLLVIILIQLAGFIGILLTGGFITSVAGVPVRATNSSRILISIVVVVGLLLAISPHARRYVRAGWRSPLTLTITLLVLALWLSLGPVPQSFGRPLQGMGLYGVLYERVPGYDGLRVPARYAMVAAVFLAIAAGYGAAAVLRRTTRAAMAASALTTIFLLETAFAPMPINQTWGSGGVAPPSRVYPAHEAPEVYRQLKTMPDAHVVVEFPFGDPAWELRYVYYSTAHWKRVVNGYSGGFPQGYKVRLALLQRLADNPDDAWKVLRDAGTTHAVVHENAFVGGGTEVVKQWLTANGAREIGRYDHDVLYSLPR